MMFYKLMYKRSLRQYAKSYINILCIFILSLSMLSFTNIYCDSYYNYNDAVLIPMLTEDYTCDIRIKNITEETAELYSKIPNVEMVYVDGNLDFYVLNKVDFETTHLQIAKIFNSYNSFTDYDEETASNIFVYYGVNVQDLIEVDDGARTTTTVFQIILTIIAVITMVLIYSDYIEHRTEDIRTLTAVGITKSQLHRLFFGECNILYLISVMIGIPLGGLIVYLFCKVCEWIDMSQTNAIYPVFDLNIQSLIITALLGYIAVYVAFRIVLEKILKIDASYTCADSIIEFNPDKSRSFYNRADRHFDLFFSSVMQKRSASKFKVLVILTAFILAVSIFMLNAISYASSMYDTGKSVENAAFLSNASLFIIIIVYAILYSLVIVHIFTKMQMEAAAGTSQILYAIGADESILYSCFYRFTIRRILTTELLGFILGFAVTMLVFTAAGYGFYVSIWFLLGIPILAAVYYFVYMHSMKKYFIENCRSKVSDEA